MAQKTFKNIDFRCSMDKINILYIIWSLGLGGAEQVVINLAKGLDKTKFKPYVACLNDPGRFADELKGKGIEVFALNKIRGIDFSVIPKLVRIIRENDIQIVHTHLWGANFWGRFAANAAGVPVVVTEHNVDVWKSPFHFLIDRWLLRKTGCFIAVSEAVREFHAKHLHTPKEKIRVVYNGVAVNTSLSHQITKPPVKQELGIKEDEKVVAVIGRLVPQKGVSFFLDVMSDMLNRRPPTIDHRLKVLIVGDGPLKNSLQSMVHSPQYKNIEDMVIFTGFRKDIPEMLSITDILVLPSTREGLPMIVLEAMVAGVVVVATRVGGTPELVEDGVNGFLVESGDGEGLKRKLDHVLNADSHGLDQIRNNARKTVEEKFSLSRMISEHQKIYLSLTS